MASRWTAVALAGLLLAGCGSAPPETEAKRPRLTLLIAVDQLRADYLTRFADRYEGGFRRLLDEGAVFENAAYRHGVTLTAAGHSAISTGMHPSTSGIPGNSWWDYERGEDWNCIADEAYETVGGAGREASPMPLEAPTFGDLLKEAEPEAKVVSVSYKDRAAILMGGREADVALWYSAECGCFISSSYYGDALPGWAADFNAGKPADRYAGRTWERLLPDAALYDEMAGPDEVATEGDGVKTVFPHAMEGAVSPALYGSLGPTPYADEMTLELALAALEGSGVGEDAVPDVLAVSFSATDYTGHDYGPFSHEAMDVHLRLDRLIGRLLDAVDERVGLENVTVALSADHGAMNLAEDPRLENGKRVSKAEIAGLVDDAVKAKFPQLERAVVSVNAGNLFLDLPGLEKAGVRRADVEAVAREALTAHEDVVHVFTHDDLTNGDESDQMIRLYRNSLYPPRSPHVFVVWREEVYAGGGPRGTSHGSPWLYDRRVPVVLMGFGVKAGRYAGEAGPEDIAPSFERILGVEERVEPDARVLEEALQ